MNQYLIKFVCYPSVERRRIYGDQYFNGNTPQEAVDAFRKFNKNAPNGKFEVLHVYLLQENWK